MTEHTTENDRKPCPAIRWAVGVNNDRACSLPSGHAGDHRYDVKPRAGSSGWEDQ